MSPSKKSVDSWLQRNTGLLRIVGIRLTSVQFTLNYLILGFDQKGALTTLVWPEVIQGNQVMRFGDAGYRDRLCELMDQVVTSAAIDAQDSIDIHFGTGTSHLHIPLRTYAGRGDRAILTGPRHYLQVL